MEALLDGWYQSWLATWVCHSRWGYAAINASHILGIALLVGAVVPLNLRLLGFWRHVALQDLVRVLSPVAGFGLVLAVTAGGLLFISRAPEYAAMGLFRVKVLLVVLAAGHGLWVHFIGGYGSDPSRQRRIALVSLLAWPAALLCGRMLAFVEG